MRIEGKTSTIAGILGSLALLWLALPAGAYTVTNYYGCYNCQYDSYPTSISQECVGAGDGEEGFTNCRETDGLPGANLCQTSGSVCLNTVVHGGLPPAGDGEGCDIELGSVCPPSCGVCNQHVAPGPS